MTPQISRKTEALRFALGESIVRALDDPFVVEVMANPDGQIWTDRIGEGRQPTAETISRDDANTIVRLLADHAGVVVNEDTPLVSATLPETGERFQGIFPPIFDHAQLRIGTDPQTIVDIVSNRARPAQVSAQASASGK
jgi:type IV secretion system protein VirB11